MRSYSSSRALVALALVGGSAGTVACGSTRAAESRPPVIVVYDEREGRLTAALGRHVTVNDPPIADTLPAAPDRAHRALVAAYSGLGIPDVIANPTTGMVAIVEHRVRGAIGRERASRFLSCGTTVMGLRADEDLVVLTVVSRLRPAGPSSSIVETRVVGTATDTRGSGARQACTTTGHLEARLHGAAKAELGP